MNILYTSEELANQLATYLTYVLKDNAQASQQLAEQIAAALKEDTLYPFQYEDEQWSLAFLHQGQLCLYGRHRTTVDWEGSDPRFTLLDAKLSEMRGGMTTVRMLVTSYLSDLQATASAVDSDRINFMKWLLFQYPNVLTMVNPHQVYHWFEDFQQSRRAS